MQEDFWKEKPLSELSDEEWEALCDGCGRCCYWKYTTGTGRRKRLYYTKVACDFLNLKTNCCTVYRTRFTDCPECKKLTKENVADCSWLPDTCAYRLLHEGKDLPPWHPLVSRSSISVQTGSVCIQDGIHEKDCDDWRNYVLYVEQVSRTK